MLQRLSLYSRLTVVAYFLLLAEHYKFSFILCLCFCYFLYFITILHTFSTLVMLLHAYFFIFLHILSYFCTILYFCIALKLVYRKLLLTQNRFKNCFFFTLNFTWNSCKLRRIHKDGLLQLEFRDDENILTSVRETGVPNKLEVRNVAEKGYYSISITLCTNHNNNFY